jgi:P-type Ca2+ transporter type 2C
VAEAQIGEARPLSHPVPPGLEGLSEREAAHVLARTGPNRWVRRDPFASLREAVRLLFDPMAVMLAIAAAIYFVLGETRDAVVLALALIPVLGVDVLLEARSRAALSKLARAAAPTAEVVRDAHVRAIPLEGVVPGDLLVLREGHTIAADGVTLWAANLAVDESSLTGESEPQAKSTASNVQNAAANARFFAGSLVVSGHGFGRVTTTGTRTQYGGIAALVARTAPSLSPLQRQAGRLVRRLGMVAVVVAIGLIPLSLARGDSWTESLLSAVSLAMAAIPEEFPIVLTLFLSVGAWRLASRGMLVRRLASVETLGSTTVICTDKTGTLTLGEFQVTEHLVLNPTVTDQQLLEAAMLACESHPVDAMERAIVAYAERNGVSPAAVSTRWTLVRDYDFDPVGKHMSHVWRALATGDEFVIAAKGAVEGVVAHSAVDLPTRLRVVEANEELAARGLRVLAVAGRRMAQPGATREDDERDLTVYGLIGFQDPLRPEVQAAVDECQRAGIRVKMITGDHALTAHAVAHSAGILHDDDQIVTGDDLVALGEREREERIARAVIFARISPAQKFLIVDALKRTGAIVAMTGDGVNDAPALRRADIGIAMGERGTDVARATADLVLLDDNFASIVATVREGRHILQNVQRAFLYLIAFHVPIVGLAIVTPLAGLPLVLLPIHLVWLELIIHPVSALVFQAERATGSVMSRPPRDPGAPLLPRAATVRSGAAGALLAAVAFAVYWWGLAAVGEFQARALGLVVLLSGYQVLLFAERLSLPGSVPRIPRTPMFWLVWIASALSLIAILRVPPLAEVFRVTMPTGAQMTAAVILGALSVAWRLIPFVPAFDVPPHESPDDLRASP